MAAHTAIASNIHSASTHQAWRIAARFAVSDTGGGVRQVSACENGRVKVMPLRRALDGIVAGDFNDPTNERLIYLSAAGLAVLGLLLLVGTLIWWRRGRQEHPALAPLEVMSGRAWATAPEGDRRRRLEQVRLSGAAGSVEEPIAAEPVDLEALVRSVPDAFDDLREPSAVIAVPAAAAAAAGEAEPVEVAETAAAAAAAVVDDPDPVEAEAVVDDPDPVEAPAAVKEEAAVDATSIATERPIAATESPVKVPVESSD